MSIKGYAPGWMARCPKCPFEVDLESLAWIRVKAYSWGKRHGMYCPDCEQTRSMRIVHVDEKGNPDQPLGLVLRKVISLQLRIWMIVLTINALVAMVVLTVLMSLGVVAAPW